MIFDWNREKKEIKDKEQWAKDTEHCLKAIRCAIDSSKELMRHYIGKPFSVWVIRDLEHNMEYTTLNEFCSVKKMTKWQPYFEYGVDGERCMPVAVLKFKNDLGRTLEAKDFLTILMDGNIEWLRRNTETDRESIIEQYRKEIGQDEDNMCRGLIGEDKN